LHLSADLCKRRAAIGVSTRKNVATRPKKAKRPREPNGRLRRIAAVERDLKMVEKLTVLAQPHRRGDLDQLVESTLRRLVIRHKLRREYFDAGIEYGGLVRHFYHAKGIQLDFSEGRSGSGLGVRPGRRDGSRTNSSGSNHRCKSSIRRDLAR
jgi:hypothetical protein